MSVIELDFLRIRPVDGSQDKGFEELCCQLASLEPRPNRAVFFRKGPGADAGVECFLRAPDGSETGWQAKYFSMFGAPQVAQLDKSLKSALGKHPNLTRYVVCLPIDLRDARVGRQKTELQRWESWTAKWRARTATTGRILEFILWSRSALIERLGRNDPLYSGRSLFWFGTTILTPSWFEQQFRRARAQLGERYTPETNVDLPIRRDLLALARDPALNTEVDDWRMHLEEAFHSAARELRALSGCDQSAKLIARLDNASSELAKALARTPIESDVPFPIACWSSLGERALAALSDCSEWLWTLPDEKDQKRPSRLSAARHYLYKLRDLLESVQFCACSRRWQLANKRRLLVYGDAGVGKSHLFGDSVQHAVERRWPAVLILGGTFNDSDPWQQILLQLHLSHLSVGTFLATLDAAAQSATTRAVIYIDAINERNGIEVWQHRLAGFLEAIEPFPRVAVAISCRSAYLPFIGINDIPDDRLMRIRHTGFAGRGSEAARVYLENRGISRPGAPNLVPEFENPLFLKTCCDSLEKTGQRELPRGLRGVTAIFDFYLEAMAKAVEYRMRLDPNQAILHNALLAFTRAVAQTTTGRISKSDALALFEDIHPSRCRYDRSLLTQLENEGVLTIEPVQVSPGEFREDVRFTFERLSDHLIARRLLDQNLDSTDPAPSFVPGTPLHGFIATEDANERAGVIDAIAVQFPERTGLEILDMVPDGGYWPHLLERAFLASLLWRDQSRFTSRTVEILQAIDRRDGSDQLESILLAVATEPTNVFNARHLHRTLMALSMPERDATWSVFIARSGEDDDSPIETLITWAMSDEGRIEEERAELAAIALSWLCSTSNRRVRDRATKALAALFAPRLPLAARLLRLFASVNDPYVLERTLAGAYGAALQGISSDCLEELATTAYEVVFAGGKPVPNILIRDNARGIVEYAHWRDKLPSATDIAEVRPPYRSDWPLEAVSDVTMEGYKEDHPKGSYHDSIVGSCVNDGDFARYVIDPLVDDWSRLPVKYAGRSREALYNEWRAEFEVTATWNETTAFEELLATAHPAYIARELKTLQQIPTELVFKSTKSPDANVDQNTTDDQEDAGGPGPSDDDLAAAELAFKNAEAKLAEALGAARWNDYRERAAPFVCDGMWDDGGGKRFEPFASKLARRWVCWRAHDLGWTSERFATFDHGRLVHTDRMNHRVERVGKKYQWLALYELTARLADNMAMCDGWTPRLGRYNGPWQVYLRPIDPSLLVARTQDVGWPNTIATWWAPINVKLPSAFPEARLEWLESDADVINGPELIEVREPATDRDWLNVGSLYSWRGRGISAGRSGPERETWCRVTCLVVTTDCQKQLLKELRERELIDSSQMPECGRVRNGFLGEHPWHPCYQTLEQWNGQRLSIATSSRVRPVITEYHLERAGYDYSLEDSISLPLPAPWLVDALGLRFTGGRQLSYTGPDGRTLFFDPSVLRQGSSVALVDREAFLTALARDGLSAVWVIAGEKSVYDPGGNGFGGRVSHTRIYSFGNNGLTHCEYRRWQRPSREQLEKLLGRPLPKRMPFSVRDDQNHASAKPRVIDKHASSVSKQKTRRRS